MTNQHCKNCGSVLGIDCGDAEPDFDENYCSKGCFEEHSKIDLFDEWLAASILIFAVVLIATKGPAFVVWLDQ
jgi:hypothetical protein